VTANVHPGESAAVSGIKHCTRCGDPLLGDVRFCKKCGAPAAEPLRSPPSTSVPLRESDNPAGPASLFAWVSGRRLPIGGSAVLVVAAILGVVLLKGDSAPQGTPAQSAAATEAVEPATSVDSAPTVTTQETPLDAPGPDAAEDPAPAAEQPRTVTATVSRTFGDDGTGDGDVSTHSVPDPSSPEIRAIDDGQSVRVACQVRGPAVEASRMGRPTTVWSRLTNGEYVTNAYLTGPKLEYGRITLPRC